MKLAEKIEEDWPLRAASAVCKSQIENLFLNLTERVPGHRDIISVVFQRVSGVAGTAGTVHNQGCGLMSTTPPSRGFPFTVHLNG